MGGLPLKAIEKAPTGETAVFPEMGRLADVRFVCLFSSIWKVSFLPTMSVCRAKESLWRKGCSSISHGHNVSPWVGARVKVIVDDVKLVTLELTSFQQREAGSIIGSLGCERSSWSARGKCLICIKGTGPELWRGYVSHRNKKNALNVS